VDRASEAVDGSAAARAPRPLWRNPNYLLLWGGQAISSIGTQASQLALPLLILAATGSPVRAGILGGLRGLAYIVVGLPAGALVDRWNRKLVMVLCDSGRALALGSIPLALLIGHLTVAQLYAVGFAEGALFIFFGLAETACLTRVVPAQQLPDAVAQNQATDAASILVGPPFGGALYGIAHALPFVADAVSYGVSVVSILFIRARIQDERTERRRAFLAEIGSGISWIWRHRTIQLLLWLNTGLNLVYGGWTLLLIELAQRLGAGPGVIGLIFASGGVGTLLGALLTPLAQRWFSVAQLIIGVMWIFALTWPPYALAPNLLALGVVNAIGFFFVPITISTQFSYRLLLVPDAFQGRVNSVFRLGIFGGQTLGLLMIGFLLQRYGPVATVWITLVPAFGLAVLPTLSRTLRRLGRISALPEVVAQG
jgi:MFS family permease